MELIGEKKQRRSTSAPRRRFVRLGVDRLVVCDRQLVSVERYRSLVLAGPPCRSSGVSVSVVVVVIVVIVVEALVGRVVARQIENALNEQIK